MQSAQHIKMPGSFESFAMQINANQMQKMHKKTL